MISRWGRNGSGRWIAGLVVAAVLGVVITLAVTVDSRIAAWNRDLAQNAAEASARAGANSLRELLHTATFECGQTNDSLILEQVQLYADLNQVPDAEWGLNVQVYYLAEAADATLVDLINPTTGSRWKVGSTGSVPCAPVRGLHVEIFYPQETLVTRLLGVEHARVKMDAAATWADGRWCGDYAVIGLDPDPAAPVVTIEGSGLAVEGGGIHSNGGLALRGAATPLQLNPEYPVELGVGAQAGLVWEAVAPVGIVPVEASTFQADTLLQRQDFLPGGYLWQAAEARGQAYHLPGGIDGAAIAAHGDGLYLTDGAVLLDTLPPHPEGGPWHLTIVTEDRITVAAGLAVDLAPHSGGVLFLTNSTDPDAAIEVVENTNQLAGLILAPNGTIKLGLTGGAVLDGLVLGKRVAVMGEGGVIRLQPAYCPPAPAAVAWIGEPPGSLAVARIFAGDGR